MFIVRRDLRVVLVGLVFLHGSLYSVVVIKVSIDPFPFMHWGCLRFVFLSSYRILLLCDLTPL